MLKLVSQFDPPQARPSQATPTCCCSCCCCCLFSTIVGTLWASSMLGERNVPAPSEAASSQPETASCQAEDAPGQPEGTPCPTENPPGQPETAPGQAEAEAKVENPLGCFVPLLSLGLLLGLLFILYLADGDFYAPLLFVVIALILIPLSYYLAYKKSFAIVFGLGIAVAFFMLAEVVVTTVFLVLISRVSG